MILDTKSRILFIHNPKAAGTSVRTGLLETLRCPDRFRYQGFTERSGLVQMHTMSHLDWGTFTEWFEKQDPEEMGYLHDYKVFGVVRDPMQRFVSAIREFEVKHHQWWTKFNLPLVDFLWEMLTPEAVWLPEFQWFRPQQAFFPVNDVKVRMDRVRIVSAEQLEEPELWDWLQVPQIVVPKLNIKNGFSWYTAQSQEDQLKISSMVARLYYGDYKWLESLKIPGMKYSMTMNAARANTDSYLWKVRTLQVGKFEGSWSVACAEHLQDDSISQEILRTNAPRW